MGLFRALGAVSALLLAGGCSPAVNDSAPAVTPLGPHSQTAYEKGKAEDLSVYAATLAEELGIEDPPMVSSIREVSPDEEGLRVQTMCMVDKGWPYVQDRDGGWVLELNVEQEEAFNLDSYVCQLQYPVAARYRQPWGREQLQARYNYLTDTYLPCVRGQGYAVGDPPTFAVFLEGDSAGRPWIPSTEVMPQVLADVPGRWASWAEFDRTCPQATPLDLLYPSSP